MVWPYGLIGTAGVSSVTTGVGGIPYTAAELGGCGAQAEYAGTVLAEVALAGRVLGGGGPAVATVFFGGGTPTLLPAADLGRILEGLDATFGLAGGVEMDGQGLGVAPPGGLERGGQPLVPLPELLGLEAVDDRLADAVVVGLDVVQRTGASAPDQVARPKRAQPREPLRPEPGGADRIRLAQRQAGDGQHL